MTNKATIFRDIPRADPNFLKLLSGLTVADLHDALHQTAGGARLLNQSMRAVTPGLRTCGQAVTAFCAPGDSLMSHCALYLARQGDVLVISNGGISKGALWGGNMAFEAKSLGLAGVVVDAPVRDVAFIRKLGLPVWASSISVSRSEKKGRGHVNLPVGCGGTVVNPGDVVVADDDGVLIFEPERIPAIVEKVRNKIRDEKHLRGRIKKGERIFKILDLGKLLKTSGTKIRDGHWKD